MQIWAESGKSALPICNYSQILYQFLTFTQNLKRSRICDNFPKYVVSLDEFDMSRNGIKHRNIRDFLLAEEWN